MVKKCEKVKIIQEKGIPKVAQKDPKRAPPYPQQIYQENEMNGDFARFPEIFCKIKTELKISSFLELANYFENLSEEMMKQKDIGRKHLVFMDGISDITSAKKANSQKLQNKGKTQENSN